MINNATVLELSRIVKNLENAVTQFTTSDICVRQTEVTRRRPEIAHDVGMFCFFYVLSSLLHILFAVYSCN